MATEARTSSARWQDADRHADSILLSLPASVAVGLPGRTLEVFNREVLEAAVGEVRHVPGFMPEWAELVYHPKVAARPARKRMRTFDGRRVTPVQNQEFIYGTGRPPRLLPAGLPVAVHREGRHLPERRG